MLDLILSKNTFFFLLSPHLLSLRSFFFFHFLFFLFLFFLFFLFFIFPFFLSFLFFPEERNASLRSLAQLMKISNKQTKIHTHTHTEVITQVMGRSRPKSALTYVNCSCLNYSPLSCIFPFVRNPNARYYAERVQFHIFCY